MADKISIYQITKEMIAEEDGFDEVDAAVIKPINSNNCKFLIKVLNSVGIDENLFKDGNSYSFKLESKNAVKTIIYNHVAYAELMKQLPQERNTKKISELIEQLHIILKNEIDDESFLQSQLAKLELVTLNRRQQLNKYLQSLSIPTFNETLSTADDEILHMYYIEEMMLLRSKFEAIRSIISEMRMVEIVNNSILEISELNSEELLKEINPLFGKIKLDRLVVKDLLNPKKNGNLLVQQTLKGFSEELNISEKKLIEELRTFRKSKYQNHDLFELSPESNFGMNGNYSTPYEVLEQAKKEYAEKQTEPNRKELSHEEITEIEEMLNNLSIEKRQ